MRSEIIGCDVFGEEEMELARSCGGEESALFRRSLPGIPHADYRVLIMKRVIKIASDPKNPATKDYVLAKMQVDDELAAKGVGIIIPAARPGRVTR